MRVLGSFFLCVLVFLPLFPIWGQEKIIQRVTAPIAAPLQSVQSALTPSPRTLHPQVNSALPGFGTLPNTKANAGGNEPALPPIFAGSLELLPQETSYLPSIYIEGQGYVPLTHPSIQPYIDPEVLQNPTSDPAVVMIPTVTSRQIETTRNTTLFFPQEKDSEPIIISAQSGWNKRIGNHVVYFLYGDCSFRQGTTAAYSPEAVVWITAERGRTTNRSEVTLYLESNSTQMPIRIEQNDARQGATKISDQKWLGHWYTRSPVDVMVANLPSQMPLEEPPIFKRALARLDSPLVDKEIVQTQFVASSVLPQASKAGVGFRQVQLNPRSDSPFNLSGDLYNRNDPASGGIVVLTGGINLIIEGIVAEGVANSSLLTGDTIDIAADNAVIWTDNPGKIVSGGSFAESEDTNFEIYLEGNIIYRDGPRVIEASRMYCDVKHKVAYILDGHLSAPISDLTGVEGSVRLKAEILRKVEDGLFIAKNAMVTTSQLGEPSYSLRSQTLRFDRRDEQSSGTVVAENNYIAFRNVPAFYWPWIATDVGNPTFYLKNFTYGNSSRNGHTIKTLWDPFQILNIRRPKGLDGDVNVAWMEKRGISHGADFRYDTPSFDHFLGATKGKFVYWGLHDRGMDKLGGDRNRIGFPYSYRYRVHWLHQQQIGMDLPLLSGPWNIRAEVGKVSDRNLLNSFFNSTWNNEENATTAIDLTHRVRNQSLILSAEYALDDHYSNANWLPRLEHYWLGQHLLSDYLTWYERTRLGLMDYNIASTPSDQTDADFFERLPWEYSEAAGVVFSTRHELDLPIQTGPVKIVPYFLGDFSAWGEDQTGESADRLYGQGGVRLNLPIWKVEPRVSSRTWYLNGLAHKIDLNAEYMYAQANHSMGNLILTDPLDHWSIDDFRRRYVLTNPAFGGVMFSEKFDPRYYALRSGMASNVTAGNLEIADDMQIFRLGMTHRFQTKRGSVGKRHILDWITVSTHVNLYPQKQHNFGQSAGLFDYNVLWHVGDRFSLFSEGIYDFFGDGQKLTRFGGVWNRPERGSFSLMLDQFTGVVEKTYLSLNIDYAMNEKYSLSYLTSYDLRDGKNVGHNVTFARTGESFRLLVGAVYSEALSEWSFSVGLEPVFLRSRRRGAVIQ